MNESRGSGATIINCFVSVYVGVSCVEYSYTLLLLGRWGCQNKWGCLEYDQIMIFVIFVEKMRKEKMKVLHRDASLPAKAGIPAF